MRTGAGRSQGSDAPGVAGTKPIAHCQNARWSFVACQCSSSWSARDLDVLNPAELPGLRRPAGLPRRRMSPATVAALRGRTTALPGPAVDLYAQVIDVLLKVMAV